MERRLLIAAGLILVAACRPAPQAAVPPKAPTGTATRVTTPRPPPTAEATPTPDVTHPPSPAATKAIDIPQAVMIYYEVTGSTVSELRADLDANGPVGYDGYKGDSTTKWFFSWNWPGYGSAACDLSAATIVYDIQVIFPRWVPTDKPAPELAVRWNNYIRRLAEHEQGHVDFVVAKHQTVVGAIKGATCLTAEIAGQAALMPIRQHDLDYDAATRHGATQGARFP